MFRTACGLLLSASLAACAGQVAQIKTDLAGQVLRHQAAAQDDPALRAFYAEHRQPLWIADGAVRPEARLLLTTPGADASRLAAAFERAQTGSPRALAAAELAASASLVKVATGSRATASQVVFADPSLAPPRDALTALRAAAKAPSLAAHLRELTRDNPLFAELAAARRKGGLSPTEDAMLQANLDRLKALPANLGERFVLVDIPAARLWLYEDGRPVHSMRVVVGARNDPTPLMAASLRYAVLNPYWNLPPDLVSERIAPKVIESGTDALAALDMEVLSGWTPDAKVADANRVDWPAVANGAVLRVRQRPGPANTLGRVKFVMPNGLGIYLHDTPERSRLRTQSAYRSAGCVRLADADRLGRWLFGADWKPADRRETRLSLARPTPVYIVYRTARVEGGAIRFLPDPYGLDAGVTQPRAAAAARTAPARPSA